MSRDKPEITCYLDDVPMRLSDRYKPVTVNSLLAEVWSCGSSAEMEGYNYNFNTELMALEVHDARLREIHEQIQQFHSKRRKVTDNVEQMKGSMSKISLNNGVNGQESEDTSDVASNSSESSKHSPESITSDTNTATVYYSLSAASEESGSAVPSLLLAEQFAKPDQTSGGSSILKPTFSSTLHCESNAINARHEVRPVNPADFEGESSPFDEALLKSIDDKQELSSVFQQIYSFKGPENLRPGPRI